MLTVENMGPVRKAYQQDLREMALGIYNAPLPAPAMYSHENIMWSNTKNAILKRKSAARRKESAK